jgi:hypothetical protein
MTPSFVAFVSFGKLSFASTLQNATYCRWARRIWEKLRYLDTRVSRARTRRGKHRTEVTEGTERDLGNEVSGIIGLRHRQEDGKTREAPVRTESHQVENEDD